MGHLARSMLLGMAVMAASCLAGCATDDHARDADAYRRVLDAGATTQPHRNDQGPLRLGDALELASRHNEQLAREGETYVQALIDKQRAAAEFLPTVGFAPSYRRQDRFYKSDNAPAPPARDTAEADLGLEWNIFRGFRDKANLYRAAVTIEQRRAVLLDVKADILLAVVDAFYATLIAERAVEVLNSSLKVQEERVRDMRSRQAAGVARPLDVSQTEAQAAATRVSLVSARNLARNGRTALALLINAPVEQRDLIENAVPLRDPLDRPQWHERAQQRREDLRASEAAIQAARFLVDDAFGQYYPTVTLNLDAVLTVDNAATEAIWVGVLRANVPIFTAGKIETDVRTAWSQVRQAILTHEYTRRVIERDVNLAYDNWSASRERLVELRIQLRAIEDAFNQADKSYNVGLATNLERLIAQDRLLNTQLQMTTEELQERQSQLRLLRAAGALTPSLTEELTSTTAAAPATQPAATP